MHAHIPSLYSFIYHFNIHLHFTPRKSLLGCMQCFYLISKHPLLGKRTNRDCFLANMCPMSSRTVFMSNVFPIFLINHKNVSYISTFLYPNASPNLVLTYKNNHKIPSYCCLELYLKYFSTVHVTKVHWLIWTHAAGMGDHSS